MVLKPDCYRADNSGEEAKSLISVMILNKCLMLSHALVLIKK